MKEQPIWIICILLMISFTSCNEEKGKIEEKSKESAEWIQLYNGKDLSNWKVKIKGYPSGENFGNTFRAEGETLRVDYSAYESFEERFGHLFFEIPFSSYKLRMAYRFIGEQVAGGQDWARKNSGVMIHAQSPESMDVFQDFPVSVEVQLLGGLKQGEERPTANVCTPGTHIVMNDSLIAEHCINSTSKTFYTEEWVELEIEVYSDSLIAHKVNGEEVMRYSRPTIGGEYNALEGQKGESLGSGYIALQSESHPIEFRNIELLNLETEN